MRTSPLAYLLLIASVAVTSGCVSRMAQARMDVPTVLSVQVQGDEIVGKKRRNKLAFSAGAIRDGLAQRQTSVLHFIPPFTFFQPRYYLEGTDWRDDRTRIENFYSLRGYFDAKVVASQVSRSKGARQKNLPNGEPEFVKVVHTVQQGEPSSVRRVRIEVLAEPGIKEEIAEALGKHLSFQLGTRFEMSAVDDTQAEFVRWLRGASYATATVQALVEAWPEDLGVEVTYVVDPGPEAVFGDVNIDGLDRVAERYVRKHIFTDAGEPWDGDAVQKTKREIYGMGVFTMVTLTPEFDADRAYDEDGRLVVPVNIGVRERKPRSFEYSPGVEWDIQGFTLVPAAFTWGNINLGKRLVRATASVNAGYRFLSPSDHFPTGLAALTVEWPDWPARNLTLRAEGSVELGVEKGYKFWTPGAVVGLGWNALPWLKFGTSYNLSFYDILPDDLRIGPEPEVTSQCPEVGKLPGNCTPPSDAIAPEFDDNYLLSYVRETLLIDLRDNPLAANKGFMLQLASDQAFPWGRQPDGALRGFRYVKVEAEARGFIPVIENQFVVALRAGGAHLFTWNDEHNLPINKAVYLGGDGTVRGFKSRYLGPRGLDADCTSNDCVVPLGARTGISGSVELRFRPVGGLWLAGFTDFGRTWGDASTDDRLPTESLKEYEALVYADGLAFSVGGGIRYDLGSIGRVRIDFAARIRKWPEELQAVREPFPWNIHFNLSESF
ncbi:MAG: BamA/TamA family outer membrane protein [Deltaproteobacteria bacterium]|nr:BamA/TamA family outer membrane protein [Deltaproteobacteria bacterium]